MALDVGADEGAEGQHGEVAGAHVVEREGDQPASQPLPFEAIADLGVDEGDQARAQAVLGETGELAADVDLEALPLRVVGNDDLGLWHRQALSRTSAQSDCP
jgi:hypothetical protein